jgi:hypothetical protein
MAAQEDRAIGVLRLTYSRGIDRAGRKPLKGGRRSARSPCRKEGERYAAGSASPPPRSTRRPVADADSRPLPGYTDMGSGPFRGDRGTTIEYSLSPVTT